METNFNLGSLKTIQAPLLDYLNSAHDNVKKNIVIFVDEKKMPSNYDSIETMSKLEKTFSMIGLHSLAIIFSLNREALTKVKDVEFDTEKLIKILQSVERVLENSKTYVKSLINGGSEQPTKFYDEYNQLAELIRKKVSIKDLFSPRLDLRDGLQATIKDELRRGLVLTAVNKKNLIENLKNIETVYLSRLLDFKKMLSVNGVFKSEEEKTKYLTTCKTVYEKLDIAQKLKISKNHYIMFGLFKFYLCILSPKFNEKFEEFVSENKNSIEETLEYCRQVIVGLMKEIENAPEGSKTGIFKVKDAITKEVLFNVINCVNKNPALMGMTVYNELNMYFNLDAYSEQLMDTKIHVEKAVKVNLVNVEKWFNEIKEEFNLMGAKKKGTVDNFIQHVTKVVAVSNKLAEAVMSVKEVHVLVSQLAATLSKVRNQKATLSDSVERELSLALVLIEYGINNIIKNNVEARYKNEFGTQAQVQVVRIKLAEEGNLKELLSTPRPKLDSSSQKADEKKTLSKVFEEVSNDLVLVEETLDLIINKKSDGMATLDQSITTLVKMKGIFSIIAKYELIPILDSATDVWKKIQKENKMPEVVSEEMRESIVLISGISLFVKSLKGENESEAEELYDNIIKIFNKGIFKPLHNDNVVQVEEIANMQAQSFEDAGVDVQENNALNTFETVGVVDIVELEDETNNVIRSKEDIVEDFTKSLNESPEDLLELVKEYLKISDVSNDLRDKSLSLMKAALAINLEDSDTVEVSKIQKLLKLDSLSKAIKTKTLSLETKDLINNYLGEINVKDINKLSQESLNNHEGIELILSGLFTQVVLLDMPVFDDVKSNTEDNIVLKELVIIKNYEESPNDEELGEIFKEEVAEVLQNMKEAVQKLEANFNDKEELTNVRRYFHTLKGSGRMVGLDYWGEAAWMTEQTLNRVLSDDLEWSETLFVAMKEMQGNFTEWLGQLNTLNKVSVDLVNIKIKWMKLNDKLINHVDIVVPDVFKSEDISEPVSESIVNVDETINNMVNENNLIDIHENVVDNSIGDNNSTLVFEDNTENKIDNFELEVVDLNNVNNSLETSEDLTLKEEEVFEDANITSSDNGISNITLKEDDKDEDKVILINGKEVSSYLYKLYQGESVIHIESLKKFVHENFGDDVELDSEFMRHSHTLASIAKTVNLQKIADIAVVLEEISFLTSEREGRLNNDEMNIVRHAVDSLELFQDINGNSDISFYENILGKVTKLYEDLVNKEEDEEQAADSLQSVHATNVEQVYKNDEMESIVKLTPEVQDYLNTEIRLSNEKLLKQFETKLDEVLESAKDKYSSELKEISNKYEEKLSKLQIELNKKTEGRESSEKEFYKTWKTEIEQGFANLKEDFNKQITSLKKHGESVKETATAKKGWLSKFFGGK